MKYLIFLFSLLIVSYQVNADDTYFKKIVNEYSQLKLDPQNIFEVNGVYLNFDRVALTLDEGQLFFTKSINGVIIGAMFFGKAQLDYQPEDNRSKFLLIREDGKSEVHKTLKQIFFIFTDSLGYKLMSELPKTSSDISNYKATEFDKFLSYTFQDTKREVPILSLIKPILEKTHSNFCSSFIFKDENNDAFSFTFEDSEVFEVTYNSINWNAGNGYYFDLICYHHKQEQNIPLDSTENKSEIQVINSKTDMVVQSDLTTNVNIQLECIAMKNNLGWISFYLEPDIEMNLIKFDNMHDANWFKAKEQPYLVIQIPDNIKAGDKFKIYFTYNYKLFNYFRIFSLGNFGNFWQPFYNKFDYINYDLNIKTPKKYYILCSDINAVIKENIDNNEKITTINTPSPKNNFAFWIREGDKIDAQNINNLKYLGGFIKIIDNNHADSINMNQYIVNVANFCYKTLGALPYDTLNFTFGITSSIDCNFLMLSNSLFSDPYYSYTSQIVSFWLRNKIKGKLNNDAQILDDLSFYFAYLTYTSFIIKNKETNYKNYLYSFRSEILEKRRLVDKTSEFFIPIGFQHYNIVNPFIGFNFFRMLHFLMSDDKTGDDSQFYQMINEFCDIYKDKNISYIEFYKYYQSKSADDISWFFNQWVFDSYIPSYKYAYKINKKSDNEFVATLKVKQSNVPQNFQMIMPITVVFENGNKYRLRALIKGEKGENKDYCEFDLPILPYEIDKIILDEEDIILSEKEDVDWEDI